MSLEINRNQLIMRCASVQMHSGPDQSANLDQAEALLTEAAAGGATVAVLPENFALMGVSDDDKRALAETEQDSVVLDFLSRQAIKHQLAIIGGSTLLKGEHGKLRNGCPVFSADGQLQVIYDKMHLFDVDLDGESYRESAIIQAGDDPCDLELNAFHFGFSICYDLRFPELYRHYADAGCHVMTVVAAFTSQTGRAHWQTLLRARAIENQCYIVASAQTGAQADGRSTWGHSMVIDPWGEVISERPGGAGVIFADFSMSRLLDVRKRLPALQHRRL